MEESWRNKGKEAMVSSGPSGPISAAKEYNCDVHLSFTRSDLARDLIRNLQEAGLDVSIFHEVKEGGLDFFVGETSDVSHRINSVLREAGLDFPVEETSDITHCSLMEPIEKWKVCITIFSPDYASTESRLNEVAKMNKCRKTSGQIILPIFYGIEPRDVQNQTGPFEESFRHYQEKQVDSEIINKWKEALREIGSLEGPTIKSLSHWNETNIIVEQVLKHLCSEAPLDNNLVGIEQPYRSVVEMLHINPHSGVSMVGICGMSGIGKTTLARAVYNNLHRFFDGCSFLSSIQERSGENGLHSLQIQLIKELLNTNDIEFRSFEDNLRFIMSRFRSVRVLIVLDGVECLDHIKAFGLDLNCFGRGSRIILTTRKPALLVEAKVPYRYFVEELDEQHALNLFYNHALKTDSPEGEYCHLSAQIASSARGIPLVIESVGSYLSEYRNTEKERWEEVLQQLKSCQYKRLQELLMLSHDTFSKGRWPFYHDDELSFDHDDEFSFNHNDEFSFDHNDEFFHVRDSKDIAHYGVVLSFDARDKVKNLVEVLHERMGSFGIGIFALNGDYMQVNGTGKILIPVISKNYASNSLCLEMLAHMVECRRSSAINHILPIFHAIEPSDIRLQTPLFETGWSLPETHTTEEFQNLINSVCQMASNKLQLNKLMKNHSVGIDAHIKDILDTLNPEVNDVRSIVIRGEDGTGKTTLSKMVYHRLSSSFCFEGCSFLTDIDERTQHDDDDDIRYLQAKLISDLLNKEREVLASVTEGINMIKERFQHMKVLIILDDVAKSFHVEDLVGQLDWFGPGSRIIITAGVTTEIPLRHSNYVINRDYQLRTTGHALLNMHASRKGDPLLPFNSELPEKIAGLVIDRFSHPCLALKIVGSSLYGKDKMYWESTSQLLGVAEADLKRILIRMSYDSLNEVQKQIFLDISCFPNEMDRRTASYLWYDSLHYPALRDLEALVASSLVSVDGNNEIWMHRVVREFGREIIDQGNYILPVERPGETKHTELEPPARMANIRFFKLDHTNTTGSTNHVMRQRDIIWELWPLDLVATLHSECLKVLDMSWSKVTEDWEGWHQIKVPQLRVLNLTGCSDLMLTPVFSFCPYLEMLILEHCPKLVNVDPSIGKLQHLTTLNLRYCLELCMLPKEVGYLTALEELLLHGTSLREIPVSIGHLKNLNCITAINCLSLRYLPSSTCDLRFVTVIKLDCANITELPYLIGKMKLQHLSLRGCRGIKRLTSLVGEVESSLVELDVSKTGISELPESIRKLRVLRVLKLDFCFITEFPPHFEELKRLEEIHASQCRSLESLPNDIGKLDSLRILKVGHSRISSVPESIKMLACLETLDCSSCSILQNLPELPASLTSLHVESKQLKEVPDFAKLKRLEVFILLNSDIPDVSMAVTAVFEDPSFSLNGLSRLRSLELCLSNIKKLWIDSYSLRRLSLRCVSLEYISSLPSTLVSLSIQDCASLKKMPLVKYAKRLEEMEILRCPQIKKIEGLENLTTLRVLTISSSGMESLNGLDELTSLTRLTLSDCPEINKIEGLEKLQALVVLTISSSRIVSLAGLDKLASLKNLNVSDCPELEEIEGLAKLKELEVLTISSCGIVSLNGLDELARLKKLTVSDCGSLSEIPDLSTLKVVEVFIEENSISSSPDNSCRKRKKKDTVGTKQANMSFR